MSQRQTRSQTKAVDATNASLPDIKSHALSNPTLEPPIDHHGISKEPIALTRAITGLKTKDHKLLLRKQTWLQKFSLEIPPQFAKNAEALNAALVFAQEEAGTAVCIAPTGILLTCSHCIAESIDEYNKSKHSWLVFRSGVVVKVTCVVWDNRRDLALLRVVTSYREGRATGLTHFPFVTISPTAPVLNSRLVCVGHPGSEDLEASLPGVRTNYDVLHVSTGHFRGYAEGQDPQDNSEIGALMHDCWTYWGHSGAPLLDVKTGKLAGLHSSWDDETGMRRGVPLEAILEFLEQNKNHVALHNQGN
ncbi:hypothetical protein GQX73_g6558 [Xylaria multiplex]|uniref:AT hook domain-containing protein family protein n=1 Tax=Xylaria multiplex TaxID=323545 RepID=A0A7C8MST2_9PEZI|nr:hypothetical protein GQX73_g6558 [Xylaria multiplex]